MKQLISLVLLFAVAVIAWWSTSGNFGEDNLFQAKPSKRYVKIFMNDFEMTAMNDDGVPAYRLKGTHLKRFNDSDDTRVEQPVFHLLDSQNQWIVHADLALLNDRKNTIQLENNVIMQQQKLNRRSLSAASTC